MVLYDSGTSCASDTTAYCVSDMTSATSHTNYITVDSAATTSVSYVYQYVVNSITGESSGYVIRDFRTSNDYSNSSISIGYGAWSKKELLREQIRQQLRPELPKKEYWSDIGHAKNEDEARARKLLRELIGEERYQTYLRRGFVLEEGKTGLRYKIRPGHAMTTVWHPKKDGSFFKFRTLCLVPKDGTLPPTDAVIMRILLIRNDEFSMQKMSNVFSPVAVSAEDARGVSEALQEVA